MHPYVSCSRPISTLCTAGVLVHCRRYTGEDGFEISVPNSHAVALAEHLVKSDKVGVGMGVCFNGLVLNPQAGHERWE